MSIKVGSLGAKDAFMFGKYKGHQVELVFARNPAYCVWLKDTGFEGFDPYMEAQIVLWKNLHPGSSADIEKSIERANAKKAQEAQEAKIVAVIDASAEEAAAITGAIKAMEKRELSSHEKIVAGLDELKANMMAVDEKVSARDSYEDYMARHTAPPKPVEPAKPALWATW